MLRDLVRYRAFVQNLVLKDLKLKYRDSFLGVVWSLAHPLLMLAVYTLAFKHILRIDVEHYAYFVLVGLLPWNFFMGASMGATQSVVMNGSLIRKVYFPRQILPIAAVLFSLAQYLLALAVFLPLLLLASGLPLRWPALLFVPLLALHLLFCIGVALFLSALTTSFRDVAHLTEIGMLLLFWLTPIVYPVSQVPDHLRVLFAMNPMAAFTVAYQNVLFWGRVPDATAAASLIAWTAVAIVAGHVVFDWYSPTFAEAV
jgi:lipopolysaccharide transport system permease protein